MSQPAHFVLRPEFDIRNQHGAPGWFELCTPAPEEAAAFLRALYGWEVTGMELAGAPYQVIRVQGHEVGGITAPRPGDPATPQWVTYVTVDDVQATTRVAQELAGAVIVPPTALGDAGSLAVIAHPTVGTMRIFQYPRPFA